MAQARHRQVRVNGRWVPHPAKQPSPLRQNQNLAALREMAMRLARHLETMLPPVEKTAAKKPPLRKPDRGRPQPPEAPPEPSPDAPETAGQPPQAAAQALAARYERLLGKSDGIIDGFVALATVVVRIVDQERNAVPPPLPLDLQAPDTKAPDTKASEQALGQRITVELDRLAARRIAQGFRGPGDPE